MSNVPEELRYAKSHEWLKVAGGVGVVGITDHAQHELTDVVFVELPAVGRVLAAGESCAVVESVKTASDIYAPAAGEVVEVNSVLSAEPGLVNSSPYDQGWFFKIKLANPKEAEGLLDAAAYRAHIGTAS